GFTPVPLHTGSRTHTTAVRDSHQLRCIRVSHPGFHTHTPGFTPTPPQSGFHTRSATFGFHTHTAVVRVSHPLRCIPVSHTWFHTHTTAVRVSHPFRCTPGLAPTPPLSGIHTSSAAFGFPTQGFTPTHRGFTPVPLHTGSRTHTTAVRDSHQLRCIRVSHPGFHTHTPGFTPTPPQSGFHTRSATFGFHTHTAVVRVSHPLRCIPVSHTWFHTHTTAVRVSHPFRCTPGLAPTPPLSGIHTSSAAFGFPTQGFTPTHRGFTPVPLHTGSRTHTTAVRDSHQLRCIRVSHPGFHTHTPGFTPTPPQSGFHTRSATFGFHTHTAVVRVSHPLRCIPVSHTWFHTHTTAVRVSHPFRCTPGLAPTPPLSGIHTSSAAFGFPTQGFTPTHRGFTPVPLHTGSRTHTTAVRDSHQLRCIRVSHPGFHTHTPGFTPTPPQSGFHTRSATFGFHTHTAVVRVSHPLRCIPVSHTWFHTHTTAVRVSHPFRCTPGLAPTPPLSGIHTSSAAFGFPTQGFTPTHRGFTPVPLHTGSRTHTTAVRDSHQLRCIRVSHPGFHTHTPGFTPTPPQSGFHTRSATFGFHTHTAVVRVSHPLRCIPVSHTWFHTHTTAVRVSHPFRCTPGLAPTPPLSGIHTSSAAFGFPTQGFTPTHRSGFHTRSAAFRFHTPGFTPTPPQLGFHTRSAAHRVSHPHHRCQGFTPAPLHSGFPPRVSHPHTGFHTHTTAVRVSHPFRYIRVSHPHRRSQGFTPAPLHSGFTHLVSHPHHRSYVFTPVPLHTGFHTHTIAVRVSHPLHCIRISHPGFHTHPTAVR
ncbi:hypothetical protein CRG98_047219, partial [Punica granatum]